MFWNAARKLCFGMLQESLFWGVPITLILLFCYSWAIPLYVSLHVQSLQLSR